MRFSKWQGLGNDYLVMEAKELPGPLMPEAISLICDRHFGAGGDGILLHEPPSGAVPGAAARMRVFNPDGSEPEMCGNGIRIFARYLTQSGLVDAQEFVVETLAGPIIPRILAGDRVRVDMGTARFGGRNIDVAYASPPVQAGRSPMAAQPGSSDDIVGWSMEAAGQRFDFTFVDVGNPHAIILLDAELDLESWPLAEIGPVIEHLPLFPNRVNVEFIQRVADGSIRMRVWERGVGETHACGTGATAVGAAAVRLGLATSPVLVRLLGGDLEIEVGPDWKVVMTGPAEEVYSGTLSTDLRRRLSWPV